MELDVLEVGVASRLGRDLGDVELVLDVAVQPEAFVVDRPDRLAGGLERDGHMPQPPAALRLGDDRALVADDRVVEPGLERVRPHRPEHAPGHDYDMDARRPRGRDRTARAQAQEPVLGDQRPVEVAGERLDLAREVGRELQLPLVRNETSASTWLFVSVLKLGMTFGGKPGWT